MTSFLFLLLFEKRNKDNLNIRNSAVNGRLFLVLGVVIFYNSVYNELDNIY